MTREGRGSHLILSNLRGPESPEVNIPDSLKIQHFSLYEPERHIFVTFHGAISASASASALRAVSDLARDSPCFSRGRGRDWNIV